MWGSYFWAYWWICPLMGLVMCLVCLLVASRFAAAGRGCMCMGRHDGMEHDRGSRPPADTPGESAGTAR